MGASVDIEGLVRSFAKGGKTIEVLRGASLSLRAGEAVALVGQSGSGKSTFLHILGALEPPTAGVVKVDGVPLAGRGRLELDRYRNRQVGFIFQFHHLLPDHTALDNVAMPALIARMPLAAARERARARLERVGMGHRLSHRPGELSGGEQQRVAIARALLLDPALLLADEPTGNLDPHTAEEVFDVLLSLANEQGTTMVVVTHSMELASRFPRVMRLRDGQFVEEA
jgi:lipoprotein-releasing system ATP-binding protein